MVWCKYTLTVIFVVNSRGSGIPVSYLLHKYEHTDVLRTWLNHLAVYVSNSPRHASWPAPMPEAFLSRAAAPPARAAVPPASPAANLTKVVWDGVAMGWRSPPGTGPKVAAAYVRRVIDDAAVAAAPAIVPEGPVIAFCPAYVGLDCCPKERAALERCLWHFGYQGHGLSPAEFEAWVYWCSWHLDQAWKRKLDEPGVCSDVEVRSTVRQQLKALRNESVQVRLWGLPRACAATLTRCGAQVPAMARAVVDGFVASVRESCPLFADYFEKWYASDDALKRWLRIVALERYPKDMHRRIPTGSQHGEGGFSTVKRVDMAQ